MMVKNILLKVLGFLIQPRNNKDQVEVMYPLKVEMVKQLLKRQKQLKRIVEYDKELVGEEELEVPIGKHR